MQYVTVYMHRQFLRSVRSSRDPF